jgi:hypothetical protein
VRERFSEADLAQNSFTWRAKRKGNVWECLVTKEELKERSEINVAARIAAISEQCTLIFLHGSADEVVPYSALQGHIDAATLHKKSYRASTIIQGNHHFHGFEEQLFREIISNLETIVLS